MVKNFVNYDRIIILLNAAFTRKNGRGITTFYKIGGCK